VNARHYGVLDELLASDFVVHSAVLGEVRGADAYKQSVLALLEPCPRLPVHGGRCVPWRRESGGLAPDLPRDRHWRISAAAVSIAASASADRPDGADSSRTSPRTSCGCARAGRRR
jgi:hypothetical protein